MPRTIAILLLLTTAAQAQPASRPRSHVDLRHGFAFAVPEAALARPPQGSGMIAKWVGMDPKADVVAWTLSFYKARPEDTGKLKLQPQDLPKYARTLQDRLVQETQLQVDSLRVTTVADKGAIDVTGSFLLGKRGKSEFRQFRRQVWILTGPQDFLVVKMEGPLKDAKPLADLTDSVLAGLRVMDADELAKARAEGIRRGSALLTELASPAGAKRLRGALAPQTQWFLLRFNGQPLGFKAQAESPAQRKELPGVQVRSWTMHRFPGKNPIVQSDTLFAADGLAVEHWDARCRMGSPDKPVLETESGSVHGRNLTCESSRNGKTATIDREIPTEATVGQLEVRNIHLPRVVGELLPRLADLSAPGVYAFLAYNPRSDRFDRRTFRVIGPDTVSLDGQLLPAVEVADSPSDETDAVRLWLDPNGLILRMRAPGGLTMERSTRQAVLKAFPEAQTIVDADAPRRP